MANNDFWTPTDSIEDIEAYQPYGIMSIIDYGQSITSDNNAQLNFGCGRGVPVHAAYPELAADIRNHRTNPVKMGQLLTVDDIIDLNKNDANLCETSSETAAMIRHAGIQHSDIVKFSDHDETNAKILGKPIVSAKGYPILLDESFFKFDKSNVIATNNAADDNEDMASSSNTTNNENSSGCSSNSSNTQSTYIGFANILSPDPNDQINSRHRNPTIGIDREIFIKPIEVYFTKKNKQKKKKTAAK